MLKITIEIEPTSEETFSPEVMQLWEKLRGISHFARLKEDVSKAVRESMLSLGLEGKFQVKDFGVEFGPPAIDKYLPERVEDDKQD